MGQAEWMLVVTIASLVGVTAMGFNLVAAVWSGHPPRPVPVTTWLGVLIMAASVLWTRWGEDETGTIVAAVATAEPICSVADATVQVEPGAGGALLSGSLTGAAGCHIWAVIHDPRTGTFWLQGPATRDWSNWSLAICLAADEATSDQLSYQVSIAAVGEDQHQAWQDQAIAANGIVSIENEAANGWLGRDITV